MPSKPRRPCPVPGCSALTAGGLCLRHERSRWQTQDTQRPRVAARGYGARHRVWRAVILAIHPQCPCGDVATIADHITPLRQGGDWSLDNGQGLCERCHQRKRGREAHDERVRFDRRATPEG